MVSAVRGLAGRRCRSSLCPCLRYCLPRRAVLVLSVALLPVALVAVGLALLPVALVAVGLALLPAGLVAGALVVQLGPVPGRRRVVVPPGAG